MAVIGGAAALFTVLVILVFVILVVVYDKVYDKLMGIPPEPTTIEDDIKELYTKARSAIDSTQWMKDRREQKEIERMERKVRKRELSKKLRQKD